MLSGIIIYYFLRNWMISACRGLSVFTMDENAIDFKNIYGPIPWSEIEKIMYKSSRRGTMVGIKLKDFNGYLRQNFSTKGLLLMKVNKLVYGCDFYIPTVARKDDPFQLYQSINDHFIRVRLCNAGWAF